MIRVLLCYARSGGTLFSKFVASQKNIIFLSEVNPNHNAVDSPAQQVKNWYGWEIDDSLNYQNQVHAIYQKGQNENKELVIRDFSFIDFTPHKLNSFKPAGKFTILDAIQKIAPIKVLGFTRNAIDVWISRGCPPKFSEGYLKFGEELVKHNYPIVKYEDFCEKPESLLIECSKLWDLPEFNFNPEFIYYSKVTGDNLLKNPSRGTKLEIVKPLKRELIAPSLARIALADRNMQRANKLLGYPHIFDDFDSTKWQKIKRELILQFKIILRRYPKDIY